MRKAAAIFMTVCVIFSNAFSVKAQAVPAQVLSPEITVFDGGDTALLSDNKRSTKRRFTGSGSITLENTGDITGLYLVWDAPVPARCTVTTQGLAPIITQGYLHEYVNLTGAVGEISLAWEGAATLCDVVALGGTEIPEWVQLWQPAQSPCDLLVLPTHADDEQLFLSGAMINATAIPNAEVQVAYMVNHNHEHYRPHELLNGLWAAGVRRYPVIPDFPDIYSDSLEHAKTIYDEQEILAYQLSLIARFRPQVIVGHDLNGEYGHGAHRLNAHTLTRAVEIAAEQPDGWDTPKLYLHLYAENAIITNFDTPLEAFGGKTGFEVAQQGFAAHKSQQTYFSVEKSGPYDCRKFGLYRTTVGYDTGNDIFENITLYANQLPPEPPESAPASLPEPAPSQEQDVSPSQSYLPQAQNDRAFAFIGNPFVLAGFAALLLLAALLLANKNNRRH